MAIVQNLTTGWDNKMNHKKKIAGGICGAVYGLHNIWIFIPYVPTIIEIVELIK